MKYKSKILVFSFFLSGLFALTVSTLRAQSTPTSWSQCNDSRTIARCETYDCPQGDTNNDGKCTLTDTNARLTDARNDSFCANPIAGCGQVHYYPGGATDACLVRVQETELNCDLYAVKTPNFTPRPTASEAPTTSPSSTQNACVSLTSTPLTGKAPLTVDLDIASTGINKAYEFEIKKPGVTEPGVVTQPTKRLRQVFTTPGKYEIKASVIDSSDKKITSLSCNATVTVTDSAIGGGGDSELPRTGPEHVWIGFAVIALGAVGVFIYEKHKLA